MRGIITPTTPLETENGRKELARQINGLFATDSPMKAGNVNENRERNKVILTGSDLLTNWTAEPELGEYVVSTKFDWGDRIDPNPYPNNLKHQWIGQAEQVFVNLCPMRRVFEHWQLSQGMDCRSLLCYTDLAKVSEELLGLEKKSVELPIIFIVYHTLDFSRVPADSEAIKIGCYLQGEIPLVRLGVIGR